MSTQFNWSNSSWSRPASKSNDTTLRYQVSDITSVPLTGHWDADRTDTITITGSGVSQWDDLSSSGAHWLMASDPARPLYGYSQNKRCVTTDANRYMATGWKAGHRPQAGNNLYIVAAVRTFETNVSRTLIGRYTTQTEWAVNLIKAVTTGTAFFVGANAAATMNYSVNDGNLHVVFCSYLLGNIANTTGGVYISVDENAEGITGTTIPTVGTNDTTLGRASSVLNPLTADIHEIAIFKGTTFISPEERAALVAGLTEKWL